MVTILRQADLHEAVAFLAKAGDRGRLEALRDAAVEAGGNQAADPNNKGRAMRARAYYLLKALQIE